MKKIFLFFLFLIIVSSCSTQKNLVKHRPIKKQKNWQVKNAKQGKTMYYWNTNKNDEKHLKKRKRWNGE